jgi:hypothetical protein
MISLRSIIARFRWTGGKGTPRRKVVKKSQASSQGDDRKLQAALKKLNVTAVAGVEEVNMFKDDGNVLHFASPRGEFVFLFGPLVPFFWESVQGPQDEMEWRDIVVVDMEIMEEKREGVIEVMDDVLERGLGVASSLTFPLSLGTIPSCYPRGRFSVSTSPSLISCYLPGLYHLSQTYVWTARLPSSLRSSAAR